MKFDILAQPSTAPPPPICSQAWERAKFGPPEVRCLQFRRRAKFGPLWVAQAAAFLPALTVQFKLEFSLFSFFIFIHYYSFASFLASASWGGWVAQAAAFLLPRTVHSSSNFLSSCFLHTFSTFRIFRFLRVIASISLVSWRREPFASKRAVNKQKSQAEILENYQALPFCFRVSKCQRARSSD